MIDRNSLFKCRGRVPDKSIVKRRFRAISVIMFKCRGRAPDKSTVKRRFRAISVTMRCCNTNVWRHCGTLATFALAAEWFPPTSLPSRRCSRSGRERKGSMRHPRRLSLSRLSHLPERWIAVIVRHRIVKLDDELAALEDARHRHRFPRRRPRAWRDANAVIANLIHPHANMPQDGRKSASSARSRTSPKMPCVFTPSKLFRSPETSVASA